MPSGYVPVLIPDAAKIPRIFKPYMTHQHDSGDSDSSANINGNHVESNTIAGITPIVSALQLEKPKRPPNAFILYRTHMNKLIKLENPLLPTTEISRRVSELWRNIGPEERLKWQHEAEKVKEQHEKIFPGYKYKPDTRKGKKRKERKEQQALEKILLSSPTL